MNQYNIWNNNQSHTNNNPYPQSNGHYNGWYENTQQQSNQTGNQGQSGRAEHQSSFTGPAVQQIQQQNNQANQTTQDTPLSPDLLINKLNNLSSSSNYNTFLKSLENQSQNQTNRAYSNEWHQQMNPASNHVMIDQLPGYNNINNNVFNLPLELQGGISNINSRRPSFTAEQSYTTQQQAQPPLNLLAHANNFNNFYNNTSGQQNQLLQNFRSRRPSIQIGNTGANGVGNPGSQLELDNGLLLNGNLIVTSQSLRFEYSQTRNYFAVDSALKLYETLNTSISTNDYLKKVIINLKKLNNLFNLIKPLVLVLTKAGKFEILSTPINSNIYLQKNDVVIVDGDRGKDLVYILDSSISLDVAILINYLKKRQHSKSMSYGGTNTTQTSSAGCLISNTVEDLIRGQGILDEETQFQIPSKQVLRFATFQEIKNLQFKLLEELKSYKTSLLKISNLSHLNNNLTILNSEYQFDQKKLTFFYFANQRLDFRNLIKELFKIYKTRIWLCAVPKPPDFNTNAISNGLNGDLNDVEFENFKVDDFHVRNFNVTLDELMQS